jgi:hypothetical protein
VILDVRNHSGDGIAQWLDTFHVTIGQTDDPPTINVLTDNGELLQETDCGRRIQWMHTESQTEDPVTLLRREANARWQQMARDGHVVEVQQVQIPIGIMIMSDMDELYEEDPEFRDMVDELRRLFEKSL